MAKYKLLSQHYIDGRLLEEGTEIGDGTPFPFKGKPSTQMKALDEAGEKEVKNTPAVPNIDTVLAKPKG